MKLEYLLIYLHPSDTLTKLPTPTKCGGVWYLLIYLYPSDTLTKLPTPSKCGGVWQLVTWLGRYAQAVYKEGMGSRSEMEQEGKVTMRCRKKLLCTAWGIVYIRDVSDAKISRSADADACANICAWRSAEEDAHANIKGWRSADANADANIWNIIKYVLSL